MVSLSGAADAGVPGALDVGPRLLGRRESKMKLETPVVWESLFVIGNLCELDGGERVLQMPNVARARCVVRGAWRRGLRGTLKPCEARGCARRLRFRGTVRPCETHGCARRRGLRGTLRPCETV